MDEGHPPLRERRIVALLCVVAALRVLVFSLALPFFNNVDEWVHFDLVVKYSQGKVPRAMEQRSDEAWPYIAIFDSPVYFTPPPAPGEKETPPLWKLPPDKLKRALEIIEKNGTTLGGNRHNQESSQPPLYYALAGFWWRVGGWLGLGSADRLYWLRLFNMPIIALIVWLGWRTARLVFPESDFLRLAVPALLAFFPQSAFYAIQNDVLAPVCFGAAFIALLRFLRAPTPNPRLGVALGLAWAATFLDKISNLPLCLAVLVTLFGVAIQSWRRGRVKPLLPALALFAVCAFVPAGLWVLWCENHFGDWSGSAMKIHMLGWTVKPFAQWWHHPIFTPAGAWTFLSGLLTHFWEGELVWHLKPLSIPAVNLFYVFITIVFLVAALFVLVRRAGKLSPPQHVALWLALGCFAVSMAYLGILSIIFNFPEILYPTRAQPYFISGRLLLGALIPFALVFVFGVDSALERLFKPTKWTKWTLFGAFLLFILAAEVITDRLMFASGYNWYHM